MNEQNNLNQGGQQTNGVISPNNVNTNGANPQVQAQPQVQSQVQPTQQVQSVQQTQQVQKPAQASIDPLPVPNVAATQQIPVVNPTTQVQSTPGTQPTQPATTQPVEVTTQPVEATTQVATQQVVQPQPQVVSTPQAQPQVQPVQAPVPQEQVVSQPVVNPTPQVQPVQGNVQDISAQAPINPIESAPTPTPGVIGPSVPLNMGGDATGVGFLPSSAPIEKKKNKPLIIVIILVALIILGAIGYFVIYPFVMKTFFSDPANVYEASIKTFFKGVNDATLEKMHTKAIYEIDLTFDSNLEQLKKFSGYTYTGNFGVDPDKELLQVGFNLKNNETTNEYNAYQYIKDGKKYLKYSTNRGYIYAGEVNLEEKTSLFASYQDLFDKTNNLESKDLEYLTNKLSTLVIGSLNKDKLSKEDTTLNVNNETIKVTNNKYDMNYDTLMSMLDYITDGLKDDKEALRILAAYLDCDEDDAKEAIDAFKEAFKDEDADKDIVITFNIYTYGNKNEVIGFGIMHSEQNFELQYYNKDNYFELHGKTSYDNETTGKVDENTLDIVGKTEGKNTNISVKLNDTEVITLVVTAWDDVKKELSYNIKHKDYKFNGKFASNYDINNERLKYKATFEINTGDEYIRATANINQDWTSDVANINTDGAVTLSDEEIEVKKDEFINSLIDTPFGELFKTSGNDVSSGVLDYYNDYNSMEPVYDGTGNEEVNDNGME